MIEDGEGALFMNIYRFPNNNYCTPQSQKTILQEYIPRFGPLDPVIVDKINNKLLTTYPAMDNAEYYYEATRLNNLDCSFCPYHDLPEVFDPEWYQSGGLRLVPTPMYGPCLNGRAAKKINCVQDQILFPPEFVGEYYFPDQKSDPTLFTVASGELFPIHRYLMGTSNSIDNGTTPKLPTNYGIGRGNILSKISAINVANLASGVVDQNKTAEFQAPYLNDPATGNERWLPWAQYYCSPACHRNSQYRLVYVRPEDYQNKSLSLSYLSRKGAGPNSPLTLIQCKTCPPFHAAYTWLPYTDSPERVKGNIIAVDCYPWFGAIPTLVITQQEPLFDITTVKHNSADNLDGVLNPLENYYVASTPCAPNTYNDVCAHAIKYYARYGPLSKAQCKPCPSGYTTEGKSGAWYCLPPAGLLFSNKEFLASTMNSNNQSLLWSRRDRLGYEFECGWAPSHCHQCGNATKTSGFLPDEFNQAVILSNILAVEPCKSGFYCPHPLQAAIACPKDFPWSPIGSFSILNCSCSRGTYLFSGNKTCVACNSMSQCSTGYYMSGWRQCMQRDGATDGGACVQCSNKPTNGDYIGGPGFESGLPPAYTGVCSFRCQAGFLMHMYGDVVSYCSKTYTCDPIGQLKNSNGKLIYNAKLNFLRDTFNADYNPGSTEMCTTDPRLTTGMMTVLTTTSAAGDWSTVSETCSQANSSLCSQQRGIACIVTSEAAFDRDVTCEPCPLMAPLNGSYTSLALEGSTSISLRSNMCNVRCNDKYYFNSTSYQCLLCSELEQAVCPVGYNIRGQGCLSDNRLFDASNLSASCTRCPIYVSSTQPGVSYLDLQAVGGCKIEQCPDVVVPANMYMSVLCGGYTRGGTLTPCTTVSQCGPNQFLYGSCTRTSTGICTNCTKYNPGYHRVAECTFNTEDSHWNKCEVNADGLTEPGFYCPGWGERIKCPNGKTSGDGAKTIDECYCIAGTVQDGYGGCVAFQCKDSVASVFAPGVSTKSHYFMDLNSVMLTECYPCGNDAFAFTRGGGVGFGSCTCPFNMYGVLINSKNLSCVQCPAAATQQQKDACVNAAGGGAFNIPTPCWRGDSFGGCQCALQPFNLQSVFGCSAAGCDSKSGFIPVPGSVNAVLSEVSSGSAMYITRPDSIAGWISLYSGLDSNVDYTVSKMLVTSNDGGYGTLNGIQYVLWTVKDPTLGFTIFTARLPPNLVSPYDPYGGIGARPWKFDCVADPLIYSLEDIAMSNLVYTAGSGYSSLVAAVVKNKVDSLFSIYIKNMVIGSDYSVTWGPEETTCGIGDRVPLAVGAPYNSSVRSTAHLFTSPVQSLPSQSTFYVGYNSGDGCGVAAVHLSLWSALATRPSVLLDLSSTSKRQITAMTIIPAPSGIGVALYVAFHNVPNSIQLIKWVDGSANAESEELFWVGGAGGTVLSLSMVWNNVPYIPAFLALVKKSNTGKTVIYTADGTQRTFTEVQGMPLFTSPSNVRGVAAGLSNGWLVASGGDTIFTIPIKQCSVVITNSRVTPRFWDGSVCVSHTCVRARLCTSDTGVGQQWNDIEMRCVCSAGYYSYVQASFPGVLFCRICEPGYFCQNSIKNSCPLSSMTSPIGSHLATNCTCLETQYFTDGGACAQCPAGQWCPNGWDKFPCLGGFDVARSQAGSIYPTMCVCAVGFVGPRCDPCSSGRYCPIGSASINTVTNLAVRITITLLPELAVSANSAPSSVETTVCSGIISSLSQTFATGGVWYLKKPETLNRRILCKFIPPSSRSNGKSMIVLVVQVETADQGNSISNSISSFLIYNTTDVTSLMTIHLIEPKQQPALYSVVNNTEQTCPTGKTPTEDKGSCYCSPGYETSGQTAQCSACTTGYYKTNAGPGTCSRCPIGMTSKIASSICTASSSSSSLLNSTTDSGAGSSNLAIIAGGVVGGVVLVALLIFGIFKTFYST